MPAARMAPASEGPPGTAPAAVDSGAGLIMPRESALQAPGAATGQAECECEAAASRAGVAQCCMVELSQQARPGMQEPNSLPHLQSPEPTLGEVTESQEWVVQAACCACCAACCVRHTAGTGRGGRPTANGWRRRGCSARRGGVATPCSTAAAATAAAAAASLHRCCCALCTPPAGGSRSFWGCGCAQGLFAPSSDRPSAMHRAWNLGACAGAVHARRLREVCTMRRAARLLGEPCSHRRGWWCCIFIRKRLGKAS